ncbi:MAG: phage portal protein [Hyphomicrobiaceae bacterium]
MMLVPDALRRWMVGRALSSLGASAVLAGSESASAEAKASRANGLVAIESLGEPVWSPRDYGAFAREGFMQNAIVYRCVRMISEAAASIPLLLYRGNEEIERHPLLDLMRSPSYDHTGQDFLESWYGILLVAGNAYVEAVAVGGEVRELHILRPDRMKVVPGPDGWPEGYEYCVSGQTVRFTDEVVPGVRPILHTRLFHPANDHYGLSPIEAAATAIDIHNQASRWNKALLDNSARPSGALVYAAANGSMTAEQFERLKRELENSYQGAMHAGRPLLLEGGLDWKPLSLSPRDMDFIAAKNNAAREIALALGVPPMLLGIPGDNTYSNYAEAQRAFWRQTVLPLVNRMTRAFSLWLAPSDVGIGPQGGDLVRPLGNEGVSLELKPDLDQVEAFNPERDALWARLQAVSFLTEDEKRIAAGYGPLKETDTESANGPR